MNSYRAVESMKAFRGESLYSNMMVKNTDAGVKAVSGQIPALPLTGLWP